MVTVYQPPLTNFDRLQLGKGSVIPLVIAFVFLQRFWQSGLAAGSVKG